MSDPASRARPSFGGDDGLGRALDRACGSRNFPGNRVAYLTDGPQAFAAMLEAIDGASHSVHFENYIVRNDATGQRFAQHLIAAAQRGAGVRVLYDALGCRGTPPRYWKALVRAGVEVGRFNRLNPLRPIRYLRRDHRKYVGIDGQRAIIGGLCIGDEWAGDPARRRQPWRDTAVDVCGPAAQVMDLSFERMWRRTGGTVPPEALRRPAEPCGDAAVRAVVGLPSRLKMYRAVELLAAGAANRLWITDAYLMAPSSLVAGLIAAARDGVDVRLLLPGKTDLPAVRAFTRVGYRELLQAGVRIWEWRGAMLHAKTVIADDHWVKVGSSNLNPSSLLSNFELDVLVEDADLATAAVRQFRHDLSRAAEVVLRPRRSAALFHRIPPALTYSQAPITSPAHAPAVRERSQRVVLTVRQVAAGARRSIAGAALSVSLGLGALFALAPRVMAYLVALLCFAVGVNAARQFIGRRRQQDE